jgi:hypothetical protein
VIGVHPNLEDLIQIIEQRNWTTLTRNERRSKKFVVAKLESMRDQLFAELETPADIQALQQTIEPSFSSNDARCNLLHRQCEKFQQLPQFPLI